MSESITISFVGTRELKALLMQWAEQDDRSVSYIIRHILEKESQRRAALCQKQATLTNENSNRLS
jgi:hypothetical protein